jgi:aryl-alcohol dehydrogenase-like predicted oxidoreductase
MISRREWLEMTLGVGASIALTGRARNAGAQATTAAYARAAAALQANLITRAIPSSGEMVPVVGLGTSATFSSVARSEDLSALKEVMKAMVEGGARVFDTAPGYGASEQVGGQIAAELGLSTRIFWATKVNAAGGRGGRAGAPADLPTRARSQIEDSFTKLKVQKIDLMQVHNLSQVPLQLPVAREFKEQGRVRYVGVTTTSDGDYGQLEQIIRNEPLDFIGIDYAVDNRGVEQTILPLAAERKVGVLAYVPFGRTSLFRRVAAANLATPPDWAKEFDAATWAQFFIKYVVSHPAVTAVTPATSDRAHMLDNIAGGVGRLPSEATRARMREFIDALPPAPGGRGRGQPGEE